MGANSGRDFCQEVSFSLLKEKLVAPGSENSFDEYGKYSVSHLSD